MRWMLALFLATTVALPARADEILPYCRNESAERAPLARLIVDLDAANARLHPPRHPRPDPRVHVTVAIVAKRIEDFCDGHPRSAEPPDVVRIWTEVTFNPIVMVAPKASVLRDISYEQYVGLREADAAYHRWTEQVGEKVGSLFGSRWTAGANFATQTQLLLDTLAIGPDFLLLPEAILQAPWRLANGLAESFCGGLELDAKRALLGVAEYEGALGTLATAGLMASAVHDSLDPLDEDTAPKPVGTPRPPPNDGAGAMRRLRYEPSPKHGLEARGDVSRAPTNGQSVLDESVRISENSSRRIGVDPDTGEIVVFPETQPGQGIFHGYVVEWQDLQPEAQNVLRRSGRVNPKGRVILR